MSVPHGRSNVSGGGHRPHTHNNKGQDDVQMVDEDIKLAIALSLKETNPSPNRLGSNTLIKSRHATAPHRHAHSNSRGHATTSSNDNSEASDIERAIAASLVVNEPSNIRVANAVPADVASSKQNPAPKMKHRPSSISSQVPNLSPKTLRSSSSVVKKEVHETDEEKSIKLAIALTISEHEGSGTCTDTSITKKLNRMKVNQTQEEKDREFARLMQEKEMQNSAASVVSTSVNSAKHVKPAHPPVPIAVTSTTNCFACQRPIGLDKYLRVKNNVYHCGCFKCNLCLMVLHGEKFTMQGDPPLAYHPQCAKKKFNPKCIACDALIEGECYKHPYFGEVYCKRHEGVQNKCFACHRLEPLSTASNYDKRFIQHQDGRHFCPNCNKTAVNKSSDAKSIYLSIVDYFETEMELTLPLGMRDVDIGTVDVQALNAQLMNQSSCHGNSDTDNNPFERPTNKSSATPHVPKRKQSHFGNTTRGLTISSALNGERHVDGIMILSGLPRQLASSVIAHEAMHVFCKLHEEIPFRLEPKVEEGLCQYMAFKYLEYIKQCRAQLRSNNNKIVRDARSDSCAGRELAEVSKSASDEWEDRILQYHMLEIETDGSPVCISALFLLSYMRYI